MYHVYYEQELLDLRLELSHHPDLMLILAAQTDSDIYIHIAEIAAYCNMLLEGDYTKDDILEVCKKCTEALIKKRTIHVSPIYTGEN